MQAIGPAAAGHAALRKLVDDDDFAVFHHILDVFAIKGVGFDGGIDVMFERPVFWVGDVANAQEFFYFQPAIVGDCDVAVFLIDDVVTGENFRLARGCVDFFAFFQLGNDAVHFVILVGRLLTGAGNNERSAGFVDED